jgi:hypothetical protein
MGDFLWNISELIKHFWEGAKLLQRPWKIFPTTLSRSSGNQLEIN